MRKWILLLSLAALLSPACAFNQPPDAPAAVGPRLENAAALRVGAMYLMDSDWDDFDANQVVPTVSVEYRRRVDKEGRFSLVTGLDFQWNSGSQTEFPFTLDVDAYIFSVPVIFGVNSATTDEWSRGKVNFFGGVGVVGVMALAESKVSILSISDSDSETEWGLGPVVNAAMQVPLGSPNTYVTADLRYSWKPIDSDGPISDLGGLEATVGIGISF